MALSFCSFSSGSSGNCYLIKSEDEAILVDAGISAKRILNGLKETDTDLGQLTSLLITHEHSDHTKSVKTILKQHKNVTAYANEKTIEALGDSVDIDRVENFENNKPFSIGNITIKPFKVSHDAVDPVGYSFYTKGKQISIVTDTGCIKDEILKEIVDADLLVLEANHDVDMLRLSRYPRFLKERILSDKGHLSNELAGKALLRLVSDKKKDRQVILAHLSKENNFPEMAYQTIKNILEEEEYYIGSDLELNTVIRNQVSAVFQV
ncbi:MAG: MBL fold metallo-hydrolase [Clostridiales bacterium]|jgi:phosphoribosyl 1,2-cyclic phosphodiesterase|nr:MBL fold metallo-hydrolase [Clostridiales bacterium]